MTSPRVKVNEGELVGISSTTINGKEYVSFKGIPYAEAPVGNRRFKDPIPKIPWDGIREATKDGSRCPQISFIDETYKGDEDCLFLNVSTPSLPDIAEKVCAYPVMVYIHGGAFVGGSGHTEEYEPDFLLEKDVLFVSINYRLGPLGFLCLDTPEVPGNAGLKDQSLAIKWVKENIHVFNGDPKNVTIFGVSAGSASVEYHLISPMSKNLFQKAIMQSGSSLNPWALTKDHQSHARKFAASLDIVEDSHDLLEQLQKADLKKIVISGCTMLMGQPLRGEVYAFTPVVEKVFENVQAFLPSDPKDLLRSGSIMNIPTITGFCSNEGSLIKMFNKEQVEKIKQNNFVDVLPILSDVNEVELNSSFSAVYTPSKTDEFKVEDEFYADLSIVYGVYESLKYRLMHTKKSNYAYIFSFVGGFKMNFKLFETEKGEGAAHGSDIPYLANSAYYTEEKDLDLSNEYLMRERMVTLWTDFAKHGNPTPEGSNTEIDWLPITENDFNFLEINDPSSMVTFPYKERMDLWEKFYKMTGPVITVKQGDLEGGEAITETGKKYVYFKGIPFAEPPTGDLRFKDPLPVKPWSGRKLAIKDGSECTQVNMFVNGELIGSEDCLYLNVFTPSLPKNHSDEKYPVMVMIHGGGFRGGSGGSDGFDANLLLEKDVVLVSINYRLGVLGFLCLDVAEVPGNAGLKDQTLAMAWVKENIESFNGDSNNITIFGCSAGSASIDYQMLSPLSEGLFHKAILQSGSSLNPWARNKNPAQQVEKFKTVLGITTNDTVDLIQQLQSINDRELVVAMDKIIDDDSFKSGELFGFAPVVEKPFDNVNAFLTTEPLELLKQGKFHKVPIIMGFCSNEGCIFKMFYGKQLPNIIARQYTEYMSSFNVADGTKLNKDLTSVYNVSNQSETEQVDNFLSDLHFVAGIKKSFHYYVQHGIRCYGYVFSFEGSFEFDMEIFKAFKGSGACHGSESMYLTKMAHIKYDNATPADLKVRRQLLEMWTSFAKFGNPTPEGSSSELITWTPATKENYEVLDINEDLTIIPFPWEERMKLWSKIE